MKTPRVTRELHYGDRVVRCFAERPSNVDVMFREAVARFPNRTALVLEDERLSYVDLDRRVEALADGLTQRGLMKGDRLALLIGNRIEFVVAVLAASRAGIISVPLNIRQRAPEIEFVLNQCAAAGLIYEAEFSVNLPARASTPTLRVACSIGATNDLDFDEVANGGGIAPAVKIEEEDVFCLLYTSGTTGRPKGAMLTHLGMVHSSLHFQYGMNLRLGTEVSVLAVPGSHVTGLVANILTMVRVGGTTVLMPTFKARLFLEIAAREGMTHSLIVPAMYNLCLLDSEFDNFDLSNWRVGGFGGAPMPQSTIAALAERLPQLILMNCYGSTETTSPVTILPAGEAATRADSVGKVLHCAEIVIVDNEGREVAPGESGELWIAGAMTVPGYWDNPEGNRSGFIGGYWRSGDIGSIDADGYVRIFDRKKDMINRAGFKIYCIEVENVLAYHPGVIECAIVGVPDPVLGERVKALIVPSDPHPSPDELRAFCAERLSDYKVPEIITFLAQPLPRNANGKVMKAELRSLAPN